jgi:hypothetical protein
VKRSAIVFAIFFVASKIDAQHAVVVQNKYNINYQKHSGYLELKTGERVNGVFQYSADEFPTYNLKFFSENGELMERFKSKDIKIAVLAGCDVSLMNKDSTVFKVLDKSGRFYRQLTFSPIEVYDNFFNINERNWLVHSPFRVRIKSQVYQFDSSERLIEWLKDNYTNEIRWHEGLTLQQIIRQLNGVN